MRIHRGIGGIKAGIGYAPDTDLAAVVPHIVDEPFDGVKGIGTFIHLLWRSLVGDIGPHVHIMSLTEPASAHVLVHKNVPLSHQMSIGTDPFPEIPLPI